MIKLLKDEVPKGIWVGNMKDGDVGVIVAWACDEHEYVNQIVQRFDDILITIGESSGCVWHGMNKLDVRCRVRLLEKGEKLVVT